MQINIVLNNFHIWCEQSIYRMLRTTETNLGFYNKSKH